MRATFWERTPGLLIYVLHREVDLMRGAINSVLADDHDEHAIAVDILVLGVAGIRHLKSQGCVKTWDACINQLL